MTDLILANLPSAFPWKNRIHYFDTIDSTNNRAKQMAAEGAPHGTALIAGLQTGGRGRMGRSFYSPAGKGVYLSMILRPGCHASKLMHLTCAAGVAACNAVQTVSGLRPGIKWTNDLVIGTHKLGGILTELSLDAGGNVAYAIVGIGINCRHQAEDFPPEIRDMATSLSMATENDVAPSLLAAALLTELERMSSKLLTGHAALMALYRQDCITLGKQISMLRGDDVRHGTAVDIDPDGALIVLFPDGHTETVSAGEVSVRGMYGYI